VKLLKSQPGKMNYASAGNGSATHMGMAYFLAKAGVEMQHVPMKSTGDAVNEVLAGRVQGVTSSLIGITAFKQDPRIKILAYTGTQRSKFMPDLPTVAEAGVPGFEAITWHGVVVPAATPAPLIERLNRDIVGVLRMPDLRERLATLGAEVVAGTPREFADYIAAEIPKWAKVVRDSGARIE
jgi:tripartite-type tricarboxylate transporter receptor subunit TctC